MSLVVTGLSHHTSPLELRERLAFADKAMGPALQALRKRVEGAGAVILSTCNRVEIYLHHDSAASDLHEEVRRFIAEWHDLGRDEFEDALYDYDKREAVGHLFRVASSLDSLVVGENQILGQVHDAYLTAHAEQTTDKVISQLFEKSFSVAKRVRSQSNISVGKVSVSSVAVDLAVSIFMDLADKTVMVIGSGDMSELTLKSLHERGVGHVIIANRSVGKAQELASIYRGDAVALDRLDKHLHRADIVISSTAAEGYVLHVADFQHALKLRKREPMFVIDIAVPRDIDHAVKSLDNVYLYDMDDLQEIADKNLEQRRNEVDHCLQIVEDGVDKFCRWLNTLPAESTIVSMSQEANAVRKRELDKTLRALKHLSEKDREEIEYLTKRITNAFLQRPMSQLKREIAEHDGIENHDLLGIVRRLFGLKETT